MGLYLNDGSNIMPTVILLDQLTRFFDALADPTRAHLLLLIRDGEKRSGDLAAALEMTPSAISHQLRWLRERDFVAVRREGREMYYTLADACIRDILDTALRHIQENAKPHP